MKTAEIRRFRRKRAHQRLRRRIAGTADKPRLAVYKSLRYLYAQVIDDDAGVTLVQATSREAEVTGRLEGAGTGNKTAARLVGELVAERAKEKGIETVVYDRGGYVFHGRIREIAEGARSKGLRF